MGRYSVDDEYEDDPEEPDESDMDPDGDDGADLIDCPHCGEEVYEYAQQCPECGKYLSDETPRAKTNHPMWVVWTAIFILLALFFGWMRLM